MTSTGEQRSFVVVAVALVAVAVALVAVMTPIEIVTGEGVTSGCGSPFDTVVNRQSARTQSCADAINDRILRAGLVGLVPFAAAGWAWLAERDPHELTS